jgi:hypothetical protein
MNGMKTWRIDTSPLILSPFEAERKPADRAFIRLHVISARREGEL